MQHIQVMKAKTTLGPACKLKNIIFQGKIFNTYAGTSTIIKNM